MTDLYDGFPQDDTISVYQGIPSDCDLKIYYGLMYADQVIIPDSGTELYKSIFQLRKGVYPNSLTGKLYLGANFISFYGDCYGKIEFIGEFDGVKYIGHINYETGKLALTWYCVVQPTMILKERYMIVSYEYDRE